MNENVYDAAVVGAGPAGSLCAYDLARNGRSVALLEKAALPRMKSCAGGIPLKTANLCDFDLTPALDCEVTGGRLCLGGEGRIEIAAPRKLGWMVMRDAFDQLLARQAQKAGAELREGSAFVAFKKAGGLFEIETSNGGVLARTLVGADGVNSRVAKQAGMRRGAPRGIGIEAEARVPEADLKTQGSIATFDIMRSFRGYGWIFPKRDHLSIGLFDTNAKNKNLSGELDRFIETHPTLRNVERIFYREGHFIPLGGWAAPLHREGVLLAGDAAGLCDPFLGEGIYYAMRSGKFAAEAVDVHLKNGGRHWGALDDYSGKIQSRIANDFRWAKFFNATVYRRPDFYFRMVRNRAVQRNIADVVLGNVSFKTCILRTIASAPSWILGR